jgi:uncharacterized protein
LLGMLQENAQLLTKTANDYHDVS